MKNIWIFNHYADPPERQATRSYDFAQQLSKKGYKVTIFSSSFNHYTLKEEKIHNGKDYIMENYGDVKFVWIKTFAYKKNDWRRVVNIIEYGYRGFWAGFRMKERPDVIMGKVFHPLAPLVAYLLSRMKGSKFFFEVGDLWPQTLIDMGRLSPNHPVVFVLRVFEKYLYKRADKIIVLLPYAGDYIKSLGISDEKIVWISNGVEYEQYAAIKPYYGELSNPVKLMYIGGFTKFHALDVILKSAEIIQTKYGKKVEFVFIGGGTEKDNMICLARTLKLKNVEFRGSIPRKDVPKAMEEASALLVALHDLPILKYGMSLNKLFDYLSSGRPVIFSGNVRGNIVDIARAGIVIPPDNPKLFAEAIERFINLSSLERKNMGDNGIKCIKENYDIPILASKLESIL